MWLRLPLYAEKVTNAEIVDGPRSLASMSPMFSWCAAADYTEEEDGMRDRCPSLQGPCLSFLTPSVLRLAGSVPAGLTRDRDTPGTSFGWHCSASLEWRVSQDIPGLSPDDYEDGAHDWNPETRPDRWVAFPKERNYLKHACVCAPEGLA